jgi:hypothetical protein
LITEESSGEDSVDEAERKRRGKKGAKGEAVHPLPFLLLGRTVPGPGEEYGAEDYVLLSDVFGDMGGKKSKPSPKPSLPLPKEVAAQKGEKPDTGPSAVKLRAPDSEAGGQGMSRKRDKEKRWADQMEEDEAELAREKASLAEERERWRANRQEEEVLNLGAPTGKTVMELLAEKEAQRQREEQPKKGRGLYEDGEERRSGCCHGDGAPGQGFANPSQFNSHPTGNQGRRNPLLR